MALTADQIKEVKAKGFLWNRGTETFSGRILTGNGVLTAEEMEWAAKAASTYGNGKMALTTRLTVECPGIAYDDIPKFLEFLAQKGLTVGGTGAKIRPVVSCKGTTCVFGNLDTQAMAEEIHEKYFLGWQDVKLPHKFKIAVGGCPNNCSKPDLNDFGIIGTRIPDFNKDLCRGCGKCQIEAACPMKAASVVEGKLKRDMSVCNSCGRCIGKCPFKASENGDHKLMVVIGGRWGKRIRRGTPLPGRYTKDEAMELLEKSLLFFKDQGAQGERFADTIERIGVDKTIEMILADDLKARKEEILSK